MTHHFPDVNVILSLSIADHRHFDAAQRWYDSVGRPTLHLCRLTQLGVLRQLTLEASTGLAVRSNNEASHFVAELTRQGYLEFVAEPGGIYDIFQKRAEFGKPAPNRWTDAYLSAFATAAGLRLVTFDRALASYTPESLLLTV